MRKEESRNYIYGLMAISILSIIPFVIISFFNRPSADDFNFSWRTFQALRNGGGFFELIAKAFNTVSYYWFNWQGTYTSAFVFSLQPAIWGSKMYAITGIVMLTLIIGGTVYMTQYVAVKLLNGSRRNGLFLGFMMSFLMIQFMPDITEGIFWFNGAMHYGLFYTLFAFFLCSLIKIIRTDSLKPTFLILPLLLGFLLEGGNQITAFMGLILLFLLIIQYVIKKNRSKTIYFTVIFLFMTICFLFSALAPGTKVRSESVSTGSSALFSIYLSIRYGINTINDWISLPLIITTALCIPVIWAMALNYHKESGFRFSNPILVIMGSIAWICSMFCPPIYAIGSADAGRIQDVIFYFFIVLFFTDIFYLCGYLVRVLMEHDVIIEAKIYNKLVTLLLLVALLIVSLDSWTVEVTKDLISGKAQSFATESDIREKLSLEEKGNDVILDSFSQIPYTLFFEDLSSDSTEWTNTSYARYYDLNSVSVQDD